MASMYIFIRDNGQERQRGFVVSKGNAHYFRLTKKSLNELLNKI